MNDSDIIKEIHGDVKEMTVEVAKIKQDLNYHIKRTDLLEAKVMPVYTAHMTIKGVAKFLLMLLPLVILTLKILNII